MSRDDQIASIPNHGQGGNIHSQHHHRHSGNDDFQSVQAALLQLLIHALKFFLLKILPHKGLDHPYICEGLLNSRI